MRGDKLASLRQKLRRGTDAFEFNALIEGVSTLDEPSPAAAPVPNRDTKGSTPSASTDAAADTSAPPPPDQQPAVTQEAEQTIPETLAAHTDRLRVALDTLGDRLVREAQDMAAALAAGSVEDAGLHLAHANQILEILHSVDPNGDLSRQLRSRSAPPPGQTWPGTAWSLVELAESPLSALLPQHADDELLRALLYAAWGVSFEPASP
ncbi:MAG: hypothetical protein ACP5VE_04735 [Chthonomonadales bacterium]